MNEYEIIEHPKIKHMNIFVNEIFSRGIHVHAENELLCILKGEGVVSIGSERLFVSPKSIVILSRADAHSIYSENGILALVIQISGSFLNKYVPTLKNTFFSSGMVKCAQANATLWNIVDSLARSYFNESPFFELKTVTRVCELYSYLIGCVPYTVVSDREASERLGGAGRIAAALSYLDENYRYSPRLFEIAEKEGVTSTYLSHIFREKLGVSFQEHLGNLRFEHAMRLIYDNSTSISEVAAESGFSDQKYMTKMFRKKLGRTPLEIRKSIERGSLPLYANRPESSERRLSRDEVLIIFG